MLLQDQEYKVSVKSKAKCLVIVVFFCLVASVAYLIANDEGPRNDAGGYVSTGLNVYNYGIYANTKRSGEMRVPTSYREPAYPTYLAAMMAIIPGFSDACIEDLLQGGRIIRYLKYAQVPLIILTAFLGMLIVRRITSSAMFGYMALFLIGLSPALHFSASRLLSEHAAALGLLLVAIAMYRGVINPRVSSFAMVGIFIGIMTLIKALFFQFILVALIFFGLFMLQQRINRKRIAANLAACLLTYVVVVAPWLFRNFYLFHRLSISEGRGGVVLMVRAMKNMMTAQEFAGSFIYWVPYEPIRYGVTKKIFGPNALEEGGSLERLNRELPSSYYRQGRMERVIMHATEPDDGKYVKADAKLKQIAIRKIVDHPVRHVLATIPFAWRGLFVECSERLGVYGAFNVLLSLFYVVGFVGAFMYGLRKNNAALIAFIMPALYMFCMHAFFSHSLARYNVPLIPVFVVTALVGVQMMRKNKVRCANK